MKAIAANPKVPESKPGPKPKNPESKPGSKPERSRAERRSEIPSHAGVGETTGIVPGWAQPGRSPEAADAIRAERDRGKENQRIPKVSKLFLGPHSVDDRGGGDSVGGRPALAGFLHHSVSSFLQRRGGILGRTSGRQRNCRAEGEARDQSLGKA